MRNIFLLCLLSVFAFGFITTANNDNKKWITLFNGKSLQHWKASESPSTFKLEKGVLVVHGPRAHLFYNGPVMNGNLRTSK